MNIQILLHKLMVGTYIPGSSTYRADHCVLCCNTLSPQPLLILCYRRQRTHLICNMSFTVVVYKHQREGEWQASAITAYALNDRGEQEVYRDRLPDFHFLPSSAC